MRKRRHDAAFDLQIDLELRAAQPGVFLGAGVGILKNADERNIPGKVQNAIIIDIVHRRCPARSRLPKNRTGQIFQTQRLSQ